MIKELRDRVRVGANRLTAMMLGIGYVEVRVDGDTRRILEPGDKLTFTCEAKGDSVVEIEVY